MLGWGLLAKSFFLQSPFTTPLGGETGAGGVTREGGSPLASLNCLPCPSGAESGFPHAKRED